jgi:hypothetical protein
VQTGFGWTNGAILDLLVRYKDTINYTGGEYKLPEKCDCEKKGPNPNSNGDGNVDCQPVPKKNKGNNILPFHISRGKRKAVLTADTPVQPLVAGNPHDAADNEPDN